SGEDPNMSTLSRAGAASHTGIADKEQRRGWSGNEVRISIRRSRPGSAALESDSSSGPDLRQGTSETVPVVARAAGPHLMWINRTPEIGDGRSRTRRVPALRHDQPPAAGEAGSRRPLRRV